MKGIFFPHYTKVESSTKMAFPARESTVFPLQCVLIELLSRQKKTSLIIAVIKKLYGIIWQVMTLVYVQG